jgi:hypothetical protein
LRILWGNGLYEHLAVHLSGGVLFFIWLSNQ